MKHVRANRLLYLIGAAWIFFLGRDILMPAQVVAGSPEDKAYQAIARETDARKRVDLLNTFLKNFPKTADLAQIYEYYAISYRELSDTDKEIDYSEKSLALRPDPQLMLMLGRVLAVKGEDLPHAIQTIRDAAALADKMKNNLPPGVSPKDWSQTQAEVAANAKPLLDYAVDRYNQIFFQQLPLEKDPNKAIAMLDEYCKLLDNPTLQPVLYEEYMRNYQALDNRPKALEYADKALALNPNDVSLLVFTTNMYLSKPMDAAAAMAQAQRAVAIADQLEARSKPADKTDDQWAKQKLQWNGMAYSIRGLVELQKSDTLPAAVADLEKARDFLPTDGVIQYQLGIAYWKAEHLDEAINALAKSATIPSGIQSQAAQLLETYYKAAHKGSTDGLKELIEKYKPSSDKPNGG
jgi:tetratricopeptide (TPR) repeat protein